MGVLQSPNLEAAVPVRKTPAACQYNMEITAKPYVVRMPCQIPLDVVTDPILSKSMVDVWKVLLFFEA